MSYYDRQPLHTMFYTMLLIFFLFFTLALVVVAVATTFIVDDMNGTNSTNETLF